MQIEVLESVLLPGWRLYLRLATPSRIMVSTSLSLGPAGGILRRCGSSELSECWFGLAPMFLQADHVEVKLDDGRVGRSPKVMRTEDSQALSRKLVDALHRQLA